MVETCLSFVVGILSCVIYCAFVGGNKIFHIIIIMQKPDSRRSFFSTIPIFMEYENYYYSVLSFSKYILKYIGLH